MDLIGTGFAAYVAPTQEEVETGLAEKVREERDRILVTVVDPLVSNPLRWSDLTPEEQGGWAQYRSELLNVPQQDSFPTVIWPTKPE